MERIQGGNDLKKCICIIFAVILIIGLSAFLFAKHRQNVLFAEEIEKLREEHPQYFDLDTSEGLNVLMFRASPTSAWRVRLVPGSKDHYSIHEGIQASTYMSLDLEETKLMLRYYDLPDEMVILRPYDDPIVSGYTLEMLMQEENFMPDLAEAFDHRYQIGEIFELIYVPEIDGFLAEE